MAITPANLYSSASAPTAKTVIVLAAAATKRVIRKVTFCNNSGVTVTVDLYINPTGGLEVQILDTHPIVDQETFSVSDIEGHVLEASGTISVTVSAAGVDLVITGTNVT